MLSANPHRREPEVACRECPTMQILTRVLCLLAVTLGLFSAIAQGAVHGDQTITGVETWVASDNPHLVHGVVTVEAGARLVIQPGVNVYFAPDYRSGIVVRGAISAVGGSGSARIVLSAEADVATLPKGSAEPTPPPAYWKGIEFLNASGPSYLENTTISNALVGLLIHDSVVEARNTVFRECGRGAQIEGPFASATVVDSLFARNSFAVDLIPGAIAEVTFRISRNRFEDNRIAINAPSATGAGTVEITNSFLRNAVDIVREPSDLAPLLRPSSTAKGPGPLAAATPPIRSAITVNSDITVNTTWALAQSPVNITAAIRVASGATLTIDPGVIVKFSTGGSSGLTINGKLLAQGTAGSPIWFTSALDSATTLPLQPPPPSPGPAIGDWNSIQFNTNVAGSILTNVIVRYSSGGVVVTGPLGNAVPAFTTNTLADNANGVQFSVPSAVAAISGQSFVRNGIGLSVAAGTISVTANTFTSNSIGVSVAGGTPNVTGNTCTNNSTALRAIGGTGSIANNTITTGLGQLAIQVSTAYTGSMSGNTATGPGFNWISVPGGSQVTGNATWGQLGMPYVVPGGGVTVPVGSSLTIQPGVVVKFLPVAGNNCFVTPSFLRIQGGLVANGTAAQPITFTSYLDDAAGGDSNGDGTLTTPAQGNWAGVRFDANATGSVGNSIFRYGGGDGICVSGYAGLDIGTGSASQPVLGLGLQFIDNLIGIAVSGAGTQLTISGITLNRNATGIQVAGGQVTVTNQTIASGGIGISVNGGVANITGSTFTGNTSTGIRLAGGATTVSGNTFAGNGVAIVANAGGGSIVNNTITTGAGQLAISMTTSYAGEITGNTAAGAGLNGISIPPASQVGTTMIWGQVGLPYVVNVGNGLNAPGGLQVNLGATLTISPGVVVKFSKTPSCCGQAAYIRVIGSLVASGTTAQPITFTSLADDTVGGDTNGDGAITTPSAGNWAGIRFENAATGTISNLVIRYAGSNSGDGPSYAAIDIGTGSVQPTLGPGNQIMDCLTGIAVNGAGSNPPVNTVTFRRNGTAIITSNKALPVVRNNDFLSNNFGVRNNDATVTLDATSNYWGAATGPSGAGPGTGDAVSANVNFTPFLTSSAVAPPASAPDLTIAKSHVGNFAQGQNGAIYTILVSNGGSGPTSGTVTATDNLPPGMTATDLTGTGWTCLLGTLTCARTSILASAASYPSIILTVNVASNAPSTMTNTATVSGGGETNTSNNSASDPTAITAPLIPDLTLTKTHTGNFTQGQAGATYTITARNVGTSASSGTVTVTDALPTGLTATGLAGAGWTCSVATLTCSRSDILAVTTSYPPINLTVNVANNAGPTLTNVASVTGGGETNTVNDTASDLTTIIAPPDLTITKTHGGSFAQGQIGASFTITVRNTGGGPTTGQVTVADTLPTGLSATAITGTGWTCQLATLACTRSDVLAGGASYPSITLTVNVANNAMASVTNTAVVSGGGETNTANDTATDVTQVLMVGLASTAHWTDWTVGTTGSTGGSASGRIDLPGLPPINVSYSGDIYGIQVSGGTNFWLPDAYASSTVLNSPSPNTDIIMIGNGTSPNTITFSRPILNPVMAIVSLNGPTLTFTAPFTVLNSGCGYWGCGSLTFGAGNVLSSSGDAHGVIMFPGTFTSITFSQGGREIWRGFTIGILGSAGPDVIVTKSHSGNFTAGQTGAAYTLTVTNSGNAETLGAVTVTDALPVGLTAAALAGIGWNCSVGTLTCSRSDVLAAGASYPSITLTANVAGNAPSTVTNSVTVSGGGETNTSNDSASDLTTIVPSLIPDLTITKSHTGNFVQGQVAAVYTLTARNSGTGPTSGTVTVIDTLPSGLTAGSVGGTGWSCTLATLTCTRTDALAPAASYPPITLTVSVANNAPLTVTNVAAVSGGGEANTSNNIGSDLTTINPAVSGNMITNGTFDTNATGWTLGGGCGGTIWESGFGSPPGAIRLSACGEPSSNPISSQTVAGLAIGQSYAVSVDVLLHINFSGANSKSFGVFIDNEPGSPIFLGEFLDNTWHKVTANFTATKSNHVLILAAELDARTPGVTGSSDVSYFIDNVSLVPAAAVPDLTITKSHTGNFTQGQAGATHTITVSNGGAGPTAGVVTVVDTLPTGLTATSLAGAGWSCTLGTLTCTRSDALAATTSYPPITLTVSVISTAPPTVTNLAAVSGGGETNTSNNSASDLTTIAPSLMPDLTLTKSHTGNFVQGQVAAVYTLTARNSATGPTSGVVTVTDTLPTGLTPTSLGGTGWVCTLATLSCTRSDVLAALASYPAITLTVGVNGNAPASVTNVATVSGGGQSNTSNDTASDPTTVVSLLVPDITITKIHSGNFTQGQVGAVYTITVSNSGAGPSVGVVTATDTLPSGLTATAISGSGWACTSGSLTCSRADALPAGSSYPAITLVVTVATNAPSSVTNTAAVAGGGEANTSNNSSLDITGIDQLLFPLTYSMPNGQSSTYRYLDDTYTGSGCRTCDGSTLSGGLGQLTDGVVGAQEWDADLGRGPAYEWVGWQSIQPAIVFDFQSARIFGRMRVHSSSNMKGGVFLWDSVTLTFSSDGITYGNALTYLTTQAERSNTSVRFTEIPIPNVSGRFVRAQFAHSQPHMFISEVQFQGTGQAPGIDLAIAKTHTGNFTQGQSGATYSLVVTNAGGTVTAGVVTVADILPAGLVATGIAGSGWTCTVGTLTCTRSDSLAASASYPAITLTVNVAGNAPTSVTNTASVSGGGDTNATNNTASDPTSISPPPDLTIAKSHTGNFTGGQVGATYAIVVANAGQGPTAGTVAVTDTLPAGLTATGMAGTGWTCTITPLSCTRGDVLAPGASFPAITLTVNVATNASASLTNTAAVSGGGESNTGNNTASDVTVIGGVASLAVSPGAVPFGGVPIATTSARTVSITSNGANPLTITSIAVGGSPFALANVPTLPFTLPPGATATFDVRFAPSTTANASGTVTIASNAPSSPTLVALSGTGTPPPLPPASAVTVATDKAVYRRGEAVVINGKLSATGGVGIADGTVTIQITVNGTTRVFSNTTGASGTYGMVFQPAAGDGGAFTVTALGSSGGVTQSSTANFRILGLQMSPLAVAQDLLMGSSQPITFDVKNLSNAALTGVTYSLTVTPPGTLTAAVSQGPTTLPAGSTTSIPVVLTAPSGNPPSTPVTVIVKITGTDPASNLVETGNATIQITLRPPISTPFLYPATTSVGINPGKSVARTFAVRNDGYAPMTNTTVTLQAPTPSWVAVANGNLGSIAPGAVSQFQILVSPPANVAIANYTVPFTVTGGSTPIQGTISVAVTQLSIGSAAFVVSNDLGTKVTGATVTLYGKTNGRSYQGVTTAGGLVTISGVEAGEYSYTVSAQTHDNATGSVTITTGATAQVSALLSYNVVTLSFTVTPTTIVDQYNVTLNVTYSTTLIKPALQVAPYSFDFSFFPEDAPNGKYACSLNIANSHPTANVRNVVVDASQLDASQPAGQKLRVYFADGSQIYNLATLAGKANTNVPCYAVVDSGVVPSHSVGNIVVQANYDFSLDGQVLNGTTTTNVPVSYSRPSDLTYNPISFIYDKRTDPLNPVLKYDGTSCSYPVKSNRNVALSFLKPAAAPFGGRNMVGFVATQGGANLLDAINLNQGNAFWRADLTKQTLIGSGDSASFDICSLEGGLTLQQALAAQIKVDPDRVLNNPSYLGFQGQWADASTPNAYLIPVRITTITESAISTPQPPQSPISGCLDPNDPVCKEQLPSFPPGGGAVDGAIVMAIDQKVRLERQAFNAVLGIGARTALSSTVASISVRDANGADASGKFFVLVTGDPMNATRGGTVTAPTTVSWQLIPTADAGGTSAQGAQYRVQATLAYVVNGTARMATTQVVTITVLPAPKLTLAYTAPFVVMNGKEAKIRVTVKNIGFGAARALTIQSAQPRIVASYPYDPLGQLLGDPGPSVDFAFTGSSNTFDETGFRAENLTIDFGDVAPGATVSGYWTMSVSRKGFFIDISSTFSHQDYQGIQLDPLILPPTTSLVPAIGGTVTSGGTALPGLSVNLVQGPTAIGKDKTDGPGNYYIADLTAGAYVAEVRDVSGKLWTSKPVTVLGNQGTDFINFDIPNFNPTEAVVFVSSTPAGLRFTVDGAATVYSTPQSFQWQVASTHTVTFPATVPASPGGFTQDQTFTGWSDGETSTTRTIIVDRFGLAIEPKLRPTAEVNQYSRTPITTDLIDHKWPSMNNLGDMVWSQKDNGGNWQVYKQGPSTNNLRILITSGAVNHERPVISDDGTVAWFQDGTGGGLGYAIMRLAPGTSTPSIAQFSSRNQNCIIVALPPFFIPVNTGQCTNKERAGGKTLGLSSDGRIASFYTFYESGVPSYRRFEVGGIGKLAVDTSPDNFPGYESPDVNNRLALVYSDGFPRKNKNIYVATTSQPLAASVVDQGENPRISDGLIPEIVYLKNGFDVTSTISSRTKWVDTGLWADVTGPGTNADTIIYEKLVNGKSQIWTAKQAVISVSTNLPEASFTVSGPISFSGTGTSFSRGDAPLGSYTITFWPVAGYTSPPSETKTLVSGGNIAFTGTFISVGFPKLRVQPTIISFGPVVLNQFRVKTFVIENTGDDNSILSGFVGTSNLPFELTAGAGNFSLGRGERKTVEVTFHPTQSRAYTDSVVITSNDPSSTTASVALSGEVAERIKVWLNAFIPNFVPGYGPGTVFSPPGPYSNYTAIIGPQVPDPITGITSVLSWVLTDQRRFSSLPDLCLTNPDLSGSCASSRMHSELNIDLANPQMWTEYHGTSGTTTLNVVNGTVKCTGYADIGRMHFSTLPGSTDSIIQIGLSAAAGDPCTPQLLTPDIDYVGTITIDVSARTVSFVGKVDGFPAFEMYAAVNGHPAKSIFLRFPDPFTSPWTSLFGPATNPVLGAASFGDYPSSPDVQVPTGTDVAVQTDNAAITFSRVTIAGSASAVQVAPSSVGALPNGYADIGSAFDITTTSVYSGSITVCFGTPPITDQATFAGLALFHVEAGLFVNRTTLRDFGRKKICGTVNSLSPFVIGLSTSPLAVPAITWNAPAAIKFGTALGPTQLNAVASVPGTLSYSPPAGTILAAGDQALSVTFTPNDTTKDAVATATVILKIDKANPTVNWAKPANIDFGTALGTTQLNANANIPGTFVFSPPLGTVLPVGNAQSLVVSFAPLDAANYAAVTASTQISVQPGSAPGVRILVTSLLSRDMGNNIILRLALANSSSSAAANVTLTVARIGTANSTPLPQSVGTIPANSSAQVIVSLPGSTGGIGTSNTLTISGTYVGGSFNVASRITLP